MRLTRVGRDLDATASVQVLCRLGIVFGSGEPFVCEDCKEANHGRLRILRAVIRARQERLSQEHELRGSESASASSSNDQSQ